MTEAELLAAFRSLDTPSVSDAMDKLGLAAGCLGITAVVPGQRAVGRAFTVKYRLAGAVERGTVGDFLDDVSADQMVVIDNAGRIDCTVWGDIMTTLAHMKGIAGTVIDGVCRDIPKIRELGCPGEHRRTAGACRRYSACRRFWCCRCSSGPCIRSAHHRAANPAG